MARTLDDLLRERPGNRGAIDAHKVEMLRLVRDAAASVVAAAANEESS